MSNARDIAAIVSNSSGGLFEGSTVEYAVDYTAVSSDHGRLIVGTADINLNLAAAATLGDKFMFHVRANGGDVTIDPDGSETINGETTLVLNDGSGATVFCDGSKFYTNESLRNSTIPGRVVNWGTFSDYTYDAIGSTWAVRGNLVNITPVSDKSILYFVSQSDGYGVDAASSGYARQRLVYYDGSAYQVVPNYGLGYSYISLGGAGSVDIYSSVPLNTILDQTHRRSDTGDWGIRREAIEDSGDTSGIANWTAIWLEIEME